MFTAVSIIILLTIALIFSVLNNRPLRNRLNFLEKVHTELYFKEREALNQAQHANTRLAIATRSNYNKLVIVDISNYEEVNTCALLRKGVVFIVANKSYVVLDSERVEIKEDQPYTT